MAFSRKISVSLTCSLAVLLLLTEIGIAEDAARPATGIDNNLAEVLSPKQWEKVDDSIDRGLAWLSLQQQRDGSFPTIPSAQPAVSSLAVLTFLAAGHEPGRGEYGQAIERGIDYVLSTQRDDGLFSLVLPTAPVTNWHQATHTAMYNHAIAGLMLSETYGMTSRSDPEKLTAAIEEGLEVTYREQRRPGPYPIEDGGWRYLKYLNNSNQGEADLSVTGWHMMFLRSATNAGFDVPAECIEAAAGYVKRCFNEETGRFMYGIVKDDRSSSRGMVGAGILSLSMAGEHNTKIARRAGRWLLEHPVKQYNKAEGHGRFHYGVHYASHAMYQLGGDYWQEFYPTMVDTMLSGQLPSGAWPRDSTSDGRFGNAYTTSLAILSLTPAYEILPIYQR